MKNTIQDNPIRVLIAEDFHADTDSFIIELKEAELSCTTFVVDSEVRFKTALSEFKPQIILSPYSLKDTNAIKLLSIARDFHCDAPFILLAFDLSEDIAIDLLGEGIEDYIQRSTVKRLPVAIKKALLRNRIQQQLKDSEASLNQAQQIAKMGSWEWIIGAESVWWSEEMHRIYEHDMSNATLNDVFSFIHPEDLNSPHVLTFHELNGIFVPVLEYRVKLKSGKIKHVISRARQMKDENGMVYKLIGTLQDVSEQVMTQQKLEAQTIEKDLILSTAKIGIWHWTVGESSLKWDEHCAQVFDNLAPSLEAWEFYEMIHPDDRKYVKDRLINGLKTGDYAAEYRLSKDGSTSYVLSRGRATFGDDGRAVRIDGIVIDMTERHLLNAARRESEQLFRDMAENISEVFWLTDWELNKVLYVSPRYESLFGQSVDELYNDSKSWVKNIHPDDLEFAIEQFRLHAATGSYDIEYRLLMENGDVKWVRDRSFPVLDEKGKVTRVAGITEEITGQKRDKDWIETLSLVASESANSVVVQDADGYITWVNRGLTEMSGFAFDELVGKGPGALLERTEANRKLFESIYSKLLKGEKISTENSIIHKDGHEIWLTVEFTPILDQNGKLKNILSIGTDISRQKELEEEQRLMLSDLKRMNKELKRRIAD